MVGKQTNVYRRFSFDICCDGAIKWGLTICLNILNQFIAIN